MGLVKNERLVRSSRVVMPLGLVENTCRVRDCGVLKFWLVFL